MPIFQFLVPKKVPLSKIELGILNTIFQERTEVSMLCIIEPDH